MGQGGTILWILPCFLQVLESSRMAGLPGMGPQPGGEACENRTQNSIQDAQTQGQVGGLPAPGSSVDTHVFAQWHPDMDKSSLGCGPHSTPWESPLGSRSGGGAHTVQPGDAVQELQVGGSGQVTVLPQLPSFGV